MEQKTISVSVNDVTGLLVHYRVRGTIEKLKESAKYLLDTCNKRGIPRAVLEEFIMRNSDKDESIIIYNLDKTIFSPSNKVEAIQSALGISLDRLLWVLTDEQINKLFYRYYTIYEDKVFRVG